MLRDKFIHYFQQWRERQLSRGEHWLAQHLAGRSPREKGMLLAQYLVYHLKCHSPFFQGGVTEPVHVYSHE